MLRAPGEARKTAIAAMSSGVLARRIGISASCAACISATVMPRSAARVTVAEMQAAQEAEIPIRRANTPEDIAAMAVFLASPGARNITGQSYTVDGGLVPS